MRFVIQRVTKASVSVDGKTVSEIGKGFLVLVGVFGTDTRADAEEGRTGQGTESPIPGTGTASMILRRSTISGC